MNAKQKHIFDIATKLFIQNGYKTTSIMDIAHTADVSQVTIYKYFESKFSLAEAVWVEIIQSSYEETFREVEKISDDFQQVLNYLVSNKHGMIQKVNKDFYSFFLSEFQKKGSPIQLAYNQQKEKFYRMFIAAGRKNGVINPELSDQSLMIYLDMMVHYFQSQTEHESFSSIIKREYKNLLQLLLYGFLGKSEGEKSGS